MKYIIYSRVSTVDQNVAMQNQTCFSHIQSIGGEDISLISEDDLSTSVPMDLRPGLQKMLGLLSKNVTVVVYSIDRLARDDIELLMIRRQIQKKGSVLHSCNEGKEELTLDLMGVLAKHEKKRIIQRTIDNLKEKQRRFEKVGTTWYGYKLDETKLQLHNEKARSYKKPYLLVPHPEESRNLELMLQWHKEGDNLYQICKKLTELGYMNRKGKPFQIVSVSRILRRVENRQSLPRKSYRKSRQPNKPSLAPDGTTSYTALMRPSDHLRSQSHQGSLSTT